MVSLQFWHWHLHDRNPTRSTEKKKRKNEKGEKRTSKRTKTEQEITLSVFQFFLENSINELISLGYFEKLCAQLNHTIPLHQWTTKTAQKSPYTIGKIYPKYQQVVSSRRRVAALWAFCLVYYNRLWRKPGTKVITHCFSISTNAMFKATKTEQKIPQINKRLNHLPKWWWASVAIDWLSSSHRTKEWAWGDLQNVNKNPFPHFVRVFLFSSRNDDDEDGTGYEQCAQ